MPCPYNGFCGFVVFGYRGLLLLFTVFECLVGKGVECFVFVFGNMELDTSDVIELGSVALSGTAYP